MGIASDVKALGEDIVASYDTRVRAIGVLVKDVDKMLKGLHTDHKSMAAALKATLNKEEEDRLNAFKPMIAEIQKRTKEIEVYVKSLLKKFHSEHKEMSTNLNASLAKGEEDRLKNFKTMMADVKKFVADMVDTTAKLMKQIQAEQKDRNKGVADLLAKFAQDHASMADELRKSLAKGETNRLEDFKKMIDSIQKYVADVISATKQLISEIRARQDERNKEVLDLLQAFQSEREKMAANWQALAATMEKKRGGKPVKIEVKQEVRTVEEAVKVEPKAKPKAEPKPKTPEGQILALLRNHPEGMTLPNLGNEAGCHFIKLTSPMRGLLDKGKVRKEDNLYFIA